MARRVILQICGNLIQRNPCPLTVLHLFCTHSHGDLILHGRCSLWRGSNGDGGRQGKQISQTPGSTAAICRKLHTAEEGEWESESSLPTRQATQRRCEAEDNTQEGAWGENTDGFSETVLCYLTTSAKHPAFKMSLSWKLSTKCSLRAALQFVW